uniref:Uncharacterized protein n=1 Tax=Romanomermis culicivorax TaxID=13658 RepID=A0A915IK85_ROMCU
MTGSRNFYEINKKALADCCAMSYLGSSMFCDPDSVFSRTEADFLNELLTDANFSGCLCSHGKMDFSGAVDDSENEKDHCFDHAHQCRKWRAEILFIDRPNIPKFDENLCSDQHHHHHHHSFTYDDRRDRTAFENFYRPDQRRLTLDDLNNFYVDQNEYGKIPLLKKLINYAKVVRRKWINDYNCRPLDLMLIAMKNVRFARNLHAWFIIPMISDDLLEYLSDNRNILKNLLEIRQSNFSLNYDNKILNANLIAYVQYLTRLMNNSPYDAKNFRFPTSNLSRNPSFAAVVIKNPPLWAYFAFSFCLIGVPLCLLLSHVISCKSDAMRDTTRKKKSEIKWSQRAKFLSQTPAVELRLWLLNSLHIIHNSLLNDEIIPILHIICHNVDCPSMSTVPEWRPSQYSRRHTFAGGNPQPHCGLVRFMGPQRVLE